MSDVAFSQAREALRLEPTFGMSVWWRHHADHHMRMLLSPEGPFATSRNRKSDGNPLPHPSLPLACSPASARWPADLMTSY
ncbi:DUF4913 domain-containing protein [Cryobacterium sp. TMT1-66-1]|uniref:DUF4913 domain-containing protein n=1 Tax=Cryobacterium sp. TMT1-66-1 TaxID=1259242 RepID=UPI00106C858E|nr:DUF4913 domain-containing protein [Cryobacterium sp. TMT1-66-1]TFD06056.1 DUF4913 domain-containing protein [Cryobacterium sp. TMT1-66-1]